jgi:predicted helicase
MNNQTLPLEKGNVIYVSGAVTDRLLDLLRRQKNNKDLIVVARDFTKIFASKNAVNSFLAKGGKINLLFKNRLLAVCVNPVSPIGYTIDSDFLCERLQQKLDIPVYDIMQMV